VDTLDGLHRAPVGSSRGIGHTSQPVVTAAVCEE
jgi:hypothetical protein